MLQEIDFKNLQKEIKPNYKNLGPKYGKEIKNIVKKINSFGLDQIKEIEANGSIPLLFNEKKSNPLFSQRKNHRPLFSNIKKSLPPLPINPARVPHKF